MTSRTNHSPKSPITSKDYHMSKQNNAKERKRLKRYIKFLHTLKDEEFYFNKEVKEFDAKRGCGTVCCAQGWMPRFNPKVFRWSYHKYCTVSPVRVTADSANVITKGTSIFAYFGIDEPDYEQIFLGRGIIDGGNKYYEK